jgi:cytochrome P450
MHAEWRAKATAEVQGLLSAVPPGTESSCASLSAHLSTIPLQVWEADTPVLDALIRETLRVAQSHAALRLNLGPEVHVNGKAIPTGAYVVYPFSDVHLDPELYPDPWKFDPSRAEPKAAFGYVGWGGGMYPCSPLTDVLANNTVVGKTVCLGTRLAKVELKLITAMILLGFHFGVVDKSGKPCDSLPKPNWNDLLLCRPPKDSCFINYKRTDTPL